MNVASYEPLGEIRAKTIAVELVDFWMVTPVWVTSAGKVDWTWLTRFWVLTVSMSSSLPVSNCAVME